MVLLQLGVVTWLISDYWDVTENDVSNSQVTPLTGRGVSSADVRDANEAALLDPIWKLYLVGDRKTCQNLGPWWLCRGSKLPLHCDVREKQISTAKATVILVLPSTHKWTYISSAYHLWTYNQMLFTWKVMQIKKNSFKLKEKCLHR